MESGLFVLKPVPIEFQVSLVDLRRSHQLIVPLIGNCRTRWRIFESKHCILIGAQKLCGNRNTNERREAVPAEREVLNDLDDADAIFSGLSLNWNDVVSPTPFNPNVNLVSLDLSDFWDVSPQVILKRITRKTQKNIDEPIVPEVGQKGLLVAQLVLGHYTRRGVGNLRFRQARAW